MKKIIILASLSIVTFLTFIPLIRAQWLKTIPGELYHDITIILDAGHGGKDGGATSRSGLIERDLVFNITKMVEDHLRLQGFNVILTRTDENDLASSHATNRKREDLSRRIDIINNSENAIAISIHANAISNTRWSGAQTFYDPKFLENKELATAIMEAIQSNIDNANRGQRPLSNIYILRNSTIPTALVEVGFLSNPTEAARLADEYYQALIAYAIFEGILNYVQNLGNIESP